MGDFYAKNVALISRKLNPGIFDSGSGDKTFEIIGGDGAPYTARVKSDEGNQIYLHSRYDPVQEAKTFIDAQNFTDHDAVICFGFGLGYHVEYLAEKLPSHIWLSFVESDLALFREALRLRDFTKLFSRLRFNGYVGHDSQAFLKWVGEYLNLTEAEVVMVLKHPASVRRNRSFYLPLESEVGSAVSRRIIELNTLVHYKDTLDKNHILNSVEMLKAPGFLNLKDKASGLPAIVIASGPSLDECIGVIKRIQNRAVIICVSRSFKTIVEAGIIPHFVTHLDMTEQSNAFFRGFDIPKETVLVFDPDGHYEIAKNYPHRKISYSQRTYYAQWVKTFKSDAAELRKGLSVAHMAFYFADYLGCDPIALVGVDLSFPTEYTHAKGVAQTWGGKVTIDKSDPNLVYLPAVGGKNMVKSMVTFQSFVTTFEADIVAMNKRVVNTSPAGARIRGTIEMPIDKFAEEYCSKELGLNEIINGVFEKSECTGRLEEFLSELRSRYNLGKTMIDKIEDGLKKVRRMYSLDPNNRYETQKFFELAGYVEEFIAKLFELRELTPLLQRLLSRTALEVRTINREIRSESDASKKRKLEIERAEKYLKGYRDALRFFMDQIRPIIA